ncbi:non-motor microtubule binding protein [Lithospermum erythrorhizon]|uniref:Non-motor microtubule binding protein n=1 Tax=Lithospermum erythrorhizon TaxID=34254 RepID=A0AAV3R1W5_LITER
METRAVDAACVLEQIELHIGRVKEEALNRKEILDKVEKWMDDNRCNAGRGAHRTLKRAEKACALVNKLPAMVEMLATKTRSWENERGIRFTYDGIPVLSMLEEYKTLRHEKEEEHKRQREQKNLQGQLIAEQEALYGSKPSPMKNQSAKKGPRMSSGGAGGRRLSLGGAMLQTPKHDMFPPKKGTTPNTRQVKKNDRLHYNDDGYATTLSDGRRGLDIAGLSVKKHSFNAREVETPSMRKPFSPISSTDSSRSNATNILQELRRQHDMLQKTLPSINTFATPSKTISTTIEEENKTPRLMANPIPSTPSTISVPLFATPSKIMPTVEEEKKTPQSMAIPIPSTPSTVSVPMQTRRAGFVLPRTHITTVHV